jgi:hypothetical protein
VTSSENFARLRHAQSFAFLMALSIVAAVSMGRGFRIIPTTPGLDLSLIYGLNYASAHDLRWGRDFISTYGPYGYVLLTMDVGDLVIRKIAFTFVLVTGTAIAAALYVRSVPSLGPGTRVILLVLLVYICTVQAEEYQWFVLLLLVLLVAVHGDGWKSLIPYAVAALLAGFYVLMKFSLGGGALLAVAAGCVMTRRPLLIAWRSFVTLCAATLGFLTGWLAYRPGFNDIGTFLTTAWEVSRGYSSTFSFALDRWWIGAASFLIWFLLLVLWALFQRGPRTLLSLATLAVPLFAVWKHSMVRQHTHVSILISFGIFVMFILLMDALSVWKWRSALPVVGILFIPLVIPWYSLPSGWREWYRAREKGPCAARPWQPSLEDKLSAPFRFCGLRDLAELRHLPAYRNGFAQQSKAALAAEALPESIRSILGGASVDVYPWEVSYVPANGLSWSNRPLPASVLTYTPILDGLNAAFFDSKRRPRYLLWHTHPAEDRLGRPRGNAPVQSVDGRHVFWDEPRTLRTILDSYDVIISEPGIVLLGTRARPRFTPPQPLGTLNVRWNTWTPVPQAGGVLLVNASIERSATMRAIGTAFREDPISLSLRFSSGEEVTFRIAPDNAAEGLWLSPFPETVDDLQTLLRSGTARRVIAVRFSTGRLGRFYLPIVVSWFQLRLVDGTWAGVQ